MTFASNRDLPHCVRDHLPPEAQDIYRKAFNYSFMTYAGYPDREDIAVRLAWAAVKRSFGQDADCRRPYTPDSVHDSLE